MFLSSAVKLDSGVHVHYVRTTLWYVPWQVRTRVLRGRYYVRARPSYTVLETSSSNVLEYALEYVIENSSYSSTNRGTGTTPSLQKHNKLASSTLVGGDVLLLLLLLPLLLPRLLPTQTGEVQHSR